MKNYRYGVLAIAILSFGLMFASDAFAATNPYNYDQCIADSGGRGGIYAVQERCVRASQSSNTYENHCAMWIGPTYDSVSTTIIADISGGQTETPFNYWGMCTQRPAGTDRIWVTGAGSEAFSIPPQSTQGPGNQWRQTWGTPGALSGTINIQSFINGVTPVNLGNDIYSYTRQVSVHRCNDTNPGSCGETPVTVTLQVGGTIPGPSGASCDVWGSTAGSNSNEGWSSVETKIKRQDQSWSDGVVWAKPGDTISWMHCYYPGAQNVAKTNATPGDPGHPSDLYSNSGKTKTTNDLPGDRALYSFVSWGNSFYLSSNFGNYRSSQDYGAGATAVRSMMDSTSVGQSNVGGTLTESTNGGSNTPRYAHVWTGNNHPWTCNYTERGKCGVYEESPGSNTDINSICTGTISWYWNPASNQNERSCDGGSWINRVEVESDCPKTIGCSHSRNFVEHKVDYGMSDSASVNIPYNYNLNADIKLNENSAKVVYAGEGVSLKSLNLLVQARSNGTTGGSYSTRTRDNVKMKVISFVSSTGSYAGGDIVSSPSNGSFCSRIAHVGALCDDSMAEFGVGSHGENSSDSVIGKIPSSSVSVYDTAAGDYFCVAAAVSPAYTGDTDMDGWGVTSAWRISGASCQKIAKKPSFQIWGGSLFSNGKIEMDRAAKTNLYGIANRPYKINGISDANVFGSWDEYGVLSIKTNKGFSSASTLANGKYEVQPGIGFCNNESLLSFANYSKGTNICNGSSVFNATGNFGGDVLAVNKMSLINDVFQDYNTVNLTGAGTRLGLTIGEAGTFEEFMNTNGKLVRYTYSGNKGIDINASTVQRGMTNEGLVSTTYIVRSAGDIAINGNIIYTNNYSTLEEMPKLIIYGKNIYIKCQVNRIDAVLIAEQVVDTCAESNGSHPDLNDAARSNQLRINGTVIADKLVLNRTYGAGAGDKSGVPAEVLNYDTSLLLWGRAQADTSTSGRMTVTYTRELAPRY